MRNVRAQRKWDRGIHGLHKKEWTSFAVQLVWFEVLQRKVIQQEAQSEHLHAQLENCRKCAIEEIVFAIHH